MIAKPVYATPHQDLILTSYELFIDHHELMMSFFCRLECLYLCLFIMVEGNRHLTYHTFPVVLRKLAQDESNAHVALGHTVG